MTSKTLQGGIHNCAKHKDPPYWGHWYIIVPFLCLVQRRFEVYKSQRSCLVYAVAAQAAPCCNPHIYMRWWYTPWEARGLRILISKGKGGIFACAYAEPSATGLWSWTRFPSDVVIQTNNNNRERVKVRGGSHD